MSEGNGKDEPSLFPWKNEGQSLFPWQQGAAEQAPATLFPWQQDAEVATPAPEPMAAAESVAAPEPEAEPQTVVPPELIPEPEVAPELGDEPEPAPELAPEPVTVSATSSAPVVPNEVDLSDASGVWTEQTRDELREQSPLADVIDTSAEKNVPTPVPAPEQALPASRPSRVAETAQRVAVENANVASGSKRAVLLFVLLAALVVGGIFVAAASFNSTNSAPTDFWSNEELLVEDDDAAYESGSENDPKVFGDENLSAEEAVAQFREERGLMPDGQLPAEVGGLLAVYSDLRMQDARSTGETFTESDMRDLLSAGISACEFSLTRGHDVSDSDIDVWVTTAPFIDARNRARGSGDVPAHAMSGEELVAESVIFLCPEDYAHWSYLG